MATTNFSRPTAVQTPSLPQSRSTNTFSTDETDKYLSATLQQLNDAANEHVEMKDPPTGQMFLVIDTNILLHYLEVLIQFTADIEAQNIALVITVPGIVVRELDGKKSGKLRLGWFARRASTWLLTKVKERKHVKGQADFETCKKSGNWKVKDQGELGGGMHNDSLIVDCCAYYAKTYTPHVCLLTADQNLALDAENNGTKCKCITEEERNARQNKKKRYGWSSRDFAELLLAGLCDLNKFSDDHTSYGPEMREEVMRGVGVQHPTSMIQVSQVDAMDVDDWRPLGLSDIFNPSHALDSLHMQVVDHFSLLVKTLAMKVVEPLLQHSDAGVMKSRFAQKYTREQVHKWTTSTSLEFLDTKKSRPRCHPSLEVFLSLPHGRGVRGARRGHDWSRQDWVVAIGSLDDLGRLWEDPSFHESVSGLQPHLEWVFSQKLRPTGM